MIPAQHPELKIPEGWNATPVGNDLLPDLPPGWPVAWDTEGSGLAVDGEPFVTGGRPAHPEARISAVSVSFRWPNTDGTPGELVDFAWPFDQGPVLGKPGTPIKDPVTDIVTFKPIDAADQAKILAQHSKALGYTVTLEMACPNLHPDEYGALVMWLDQRDNLAAHNSVHDMHQQRVGLRADAGGFGGPEGLWAWDPDSEPGSLAKSIMDGEPPHLHMMEPTLVPLSFAKSRRNVWCTMVVQKQVVDPLQPAALKQTSRRLWGDDSTEEEAALADELKRQGVGLTKRYDLLPWCGAVGVYAAKDTNLCYRLWEYQENVGEEGLIPKYWELVNTEMELRTTLYRMERRGVAYNAPESFAEGERMRQINEEQARHLPFDPSKPVQAKRFYFGPTCSQAATRTVGGHEVPMFCAKSCPECAGKNGLGLEPTERTPTGLPKLDIDEVRRLQEQGQPFAVEYYAWTKRRSADSKWYTKWAARVGRDGRIRTSFKQCKNDRERAGAAEGGTKSGRLAVGRWQCQAIPHGKLIPEGAKPVRPMIGNVEPGTEIVRWDGKREKTKVKRVQFEHDLSAGEVRVVTVISGSTKFWDALDAGADMHALNAKALFGVDEDHPDFQHLRSAAKRGTFGIIYLGGVKAIQTQMEAASGMRMKTADVQAAKDRFWAENPEIKAFSDTAVRKVTRWMGGPGYLRMLDGWRRWYALDEKTVSAPNQVIQGNLARAMIYWMTAVEREVPGCLLLQIHDSLVTEHDDTPEGHAEAQRVSDIGQRVFQEYFNVRGRVMDFGISPDRWDKKS
ncbi:DNA polymerase I [Streptomyces phage Keanu]|nr:DNA polymerase I [Streptomyces phage Keanu]